MIKNNKGFSLIELMVVVAIIGILASFAIPQYQSFQAKARQKEGVSLLGSYYTAQKATEIDMGTQTLNFVAIGFNPTGQLHYRITTLAGAAAPAGFATDVTCLATNVACTFTEAYVEVATGTWLPVTATTAAAYNAAARTYLVTAGSRINGAAAGAIDSWTVSEGKIITNTVNGIY